MQLLFQSLGLLPYSWRWPFILVGALALALAIGGTWARVRIWGLGKAESWDLPGRPSMGRLLWLSLTKLFSADCLFARRVFARSRWRGWMVVGFVWGSLALLLAVVLSAVYFAVGRAFPTGLDAWISPVLDVAGLILLVGLLAALVRRYVLPPQRWISVSSDGVMLALFVISVASGLLLEGIRLAGSEWQAVARWPVGALLAQGLDWLRWTPATSGRVYLAMYLAHAGSGLALVAYLPFSKMVHVLASQITTFAAKRSPSAAALQVDSQ
ncbi:MAG TPA: respiratory nitrate reductase subunit gamma [Anaerolineales bacterium]|nr:respiratory nitrate reductase subunit gamma [Anaerolineales bacterium]